MPRPRSVRPRDPNQQWRTVPMPGADQQLELVPLEADGDGFTILGRFPVGFLRTQPGGYLAAEDVIVLEGSLELEGHCYGRDTLVHIPASYRRTSMRTPAGCLVLAWFSGPALFRPPDELMPAPEAEVRSVDRIGAGDGGLLETAVSHWSVVRADRRPRGADAVDLKLAMWTRPDADWPGPIPEQVVARVASR